MWELSNQYISREVVLIGWIQIVEIFSHILLCSSYETGLRGWGFAFCLGSFKSPFFYVLCRYRSAIPLISGGITRDISKSKNSIRQLISGNLFLCISWVSVETNTLFVACVLLLERAAPAVLGKTSTDTGHVVWVKILTWAICTGSAGITPRLGWACEGPGGAEGGLWAR